MDEASDLAGGGSARGCGRSERSGYVVAQESDGSTELRSVAAADASALAADAADAAAAATATSVLSGTAAVRAAAAAIRFAMQQLQPVPQQGSQMQVAVVKQAQQLIQVGQQGQVRAQMAHFETPKPTRPSGDQIMGACSTSTVVDVRHVDMSTLQTKGGTPTKHGIMAGQGEQGGELWQQAMVKAKAEMVVEFGEVNSCDRCNRLYEYVLRDKVKRLYSKLKHRKQAKDKRKGTR